MKVLILSTLLLIHIFGCNTTQPPPPPLCTPNGFINTTTATDAQLLALWKGAQQQLATQKIPLDPVTHPKNITYAPPDPRALNIWPNCRVTIVTVPNVLTPPKAGYKCSSPTGYCAGETLGSGPWTIKVVAPDLLNPGATGWEMQNVILEILKYNVKGR